jgi:hypothetical protein
MKNTFSSQILAPSLLAVAITLALTGCGDTARPATPRDAYVAMLRRLDTATTKQEALSIAARVPGWAESSDAFASEMFAEVKAGRSKDVRIEWLEVTALERRWKELPFRDEIIAKQKAEADAKAKAAAEAAAIAAYRSLPITDPRAAYAALRDSGTAAPATTGSWTPVATTPASVDAEPVAITDNLIGLFVSADETAIVAWGPKALIISTDGGSSWTRRDVGVQQAIAGNGGGVIALTNDGTLVDGSGYLLSDELPRAYALAAGWGKQVIATKSTVQWIGLGEHGATVTAKAPRPDGTLLAGISRDGAAILIGRGGRATAVLPGGAAGTVPPLVGAARAATAKPAADYEPGLLVPLTTPSGDGLWAVDGKFFVACPGGPASLMRAGDLMLSFGDVRVAVDANGIAEITDWSGPESAAGRTFGRSAGSTGLPAGTRAVEAAGTTLYAVGAKGLWRCPRWATAQP